MPNVDIDETEPEAARNGTAAHELASVILHDVLTVGRSVSAHRLEWYEGREASNGIPWTRDHHVAAVAYCRDVISQIQNAAPNGEKYYFGIEEPLTIPAIHPQLAGTCDFWAYFPHADMLIVFDFKSGFVFVDEYENPQGVCYISGVQSRLVACGLRGGYQDDMKIRFRIYQPNCFATDRSAGRTWQTTGFEMLKHVRTLAGAARVATSPGANLSTGEHCRRCAVRHACPVLASTVSAYMDMVGDMRTDIPDGHDLAFRLREITRIHDFVKSYREALEAHAVETIRNGERVPGFEYKAGSAGRRVWRDDGLASALLVGCAAVRMLNGASPLLKDPDFVTPRQAEIAGLPPDVVGKLSRHAPGRPRLLPETQQDLERIFGNVKRTAS